MNEEKKKLIQVIKRHLTGLTKAFLRLIFIIEEK